jgi:Tetratricopeptide repeat
VAAVTAAILQTRRRLHGKAATRRLIHGLVGAAPQVKDISDPVILGLHPAALGGEGLDQLPPYVPRDSDAQLRQALAEPGFVLVVGDAAAGKTRSAYEAIRTMLPEHILIAPRRREEIAAAIEAAVLTRQSVLWLDDLESYLGPDGLSPGQIWQVVAGEDHHRVIVATMRSAAEEHLSSSDPEARAVLAQARRIAVSRTFSLAEQKRARSREDPRLVEALANPGGYGVTEYLAAGPQLLKEWEEAWAPGSHPRGAALVAAAVDLRRAGFTSPLPRRLLEELAETYLAQRGGQRLRPESAEDAWRWAARPHRSGTSLLIPVGEDRYEAFDYLTDIVQERSPAGEYVPAEVIYAALPYADAADATNIATIAQSKGRYQLAEAAIRRALAIQDVHGHDEAPTLTSRSMLVAVLYALGRLNEAEAEGRAVVVDQIRVLGPDHPATLTSRRMLARIQADLASLPGEGDRRL